MKIVGGIGVPHTPHFPGIVENDGNGADELRRLYGELRERLEELDPDVIIFFSSDHYNLFFQHVPIFTIGVAPSAHGPSDYPLHEYEIPVDAELAAGLQARLMEAEFDVGRLREFELDHPFTIPFHFMRPQVDVPIVPVWISAFMRPLPTSQRCFALGREIGRVLSESPDPRRVAVIATGSFSLEIGGPRMSATSHTGVPAPQWVDRVLDLMSAGDPDTLVAEATDKQLLDAGNAGGEVLLWLAMLGTLAGAPRPVFLEAQRELGHAYGAWLRNGHAP